MAKATTTLQEIMQDREVRITYRELKSMLAFQGIELPEPTTEGVNDLSVQIGRGSTTEPGAWDGESPLYLAPGTDLDDTLIILSWSTRRTNQDGAIPTEDIKALLERLNSRDAGKGVRLTEEETNRIANALAVLR